MQLFASRNRSRIAASLENIQNTKCLKTKAKSTNEKKKQFCDMLPHVNKCADYDYTNRFGWNLQKLSVFDDFHICHFKNKVNKYARSLPSRSYPSYCTRPVPVLYPYCSRTRTVHVLSGVCRFAVFLFESFRGLFFILLQRVWCENNNGHNVFFDLAALRFL